MTEPKKKKRRRARGDRQAQQQRRRERGRARRVASRHFTDRPVCTIFADASYRDKVGSWGCWIKADDQPALTHGAALAGMIPSSVEAEARALANALAVAIAANLVKAGDVVMVQSDCQAALSRILGAYHRSCDRPAACGVPTPIAKRVEKALRESAGLRGFVKMADKLELRIAVRHVRGHKSGDGRQWVNRHVDAIAKTHRPNREPERRRDEPDAAPDAA